MARRLCACLLSLGIAIALLTPARAGAPDPRTLRDQLEDQLADGDRDAEDVLALQLAPPQSVPRRWAPAYVGIEAFAEDRASGSIALGVVLVLELPLDRFAEVPASVHRSSAHSAIFTSKSALMIPEHRGGSSEASRVGWGPLKTTLLLGGEARASPKRASLLAGDTGESQHIRPFHHDAPPQGLFQQTVARIESKIAPAPVVTSDIARACVRAALRTAGLADDSRLDSIAARARSSAALPELRLRAARTSDQSGRVTLSDSDLYRYIEAGGATNVLEARLTFRLDRLLFADDEIAVERIRVDRSELRARTAAKALQALFEWQRAYALQQDPGLSADEHFSAALRELEAGAILDVMTDGWFSRFRASLASREGANR